MGVLLGQELIFSDTKVYRSSTHFHLPSSILIWVHILLKKLWTLRRSNEFSKMGTYLQLHKHICTAFPTLHRNFPCFKQKRQTRHSAWKQPWCSKMVSRKTLRNTKHGSDFSLFFGKREDTLEIKTKPTFRRKSGKNWQCFWMVSYTCRRRVKQPLANPCIEALQCSS